MGAEKTVIDQAINRAVQRVLEDTHCYVQKTDYTGWDGTSTDYTLDPAILDIHEMYVSSAGTIYSLERLSLTNILEKRRTGQPSGSPVQFFCVNGGNLLLFYPTIGANDTLTVYYVPIPTALAADTDDPSTTTFGGIPEILHEGIFLYACSKLASYDDDQTSAQGQRYRDLYDLEITRYHKILRERGGTRNARAVVNEKRRRRVFHDNSVYPGGSA